MKKFKHVAFVVLAALLIVGTTAVLAQENEPPVERNTIESGSNQTIPYPEDNLQLFVIPSGEYETASDADVSSRSQEFGSFAVMEPGVAPNSPSLGELGDVTLDNVPFEISAEETLNSGGTPFKEGVSPGD